MKTENFTNWDPFYAVDTGIVCALPYAVAGLKLGEEFTYSGRFDGFVLCRTGGSRIKVSKGSLATM
jgi:hypothetical protein